MGRLGEYWEIAPLPYWSGKGLSGCFAIAYGENKTGSEVRLCLPR